MAQFTPGLDPQSAQFASQSAFPGGSMPTSGSTTPPTPPSGSASTSDNSGLPQPNFQFGATGSQFGFSQYMQMAVDRLNAINPALQQRQLLLKHLYDTPLSQQDLQQLPPELQRTVNTGDKSEIELAARVLNDQISGRAQTLDQSLQFLTQGYQASVQDLETQRQQKVAQAEFILKNTPSAVLRKTYSSQQLDALGTSLGYPAGALSDPNFKTDKDIQLENAQINAQSLAVSRESLALQRGTTQQDKLEQQYRTVKEKALSNRSGGLGLQDAKVNNANELSTLARQYYDSKTGNYNVPKSQIGELVLGLANLISPTGGATDATRSEILTRTAKGDISGVLTYLTGVPQTGNTQAVINNLIDSIDRQGKLAQQQRQTYFKYIHGLVPTGLEQGRIDALDAEGLNPYAPIKGGQTDGSYDAYLKSLGL